jgi:hypothetical protein
MAKTAWLDHDATSRKYIQNYVQHLTEIALAFITKCHMAQFVSKVGCAFTTGSARVTWWDIQARVLQEEVSRS